MRYIKLMLRFTFGMALILTLYTLSAQDEKGDLVLVMEEHVTPELIPEYEQWGKDLKELAETAEFRPFFVGSTMGSFSYVFPAGKDLASIEKVDADFEAFAEANSGVGDLYAKYKHTMTHTKRSVWRHSPKYSYLPDGYEPSYDDTYVRSYKAFLKVGQREAAGKVLDEFKETFAAAGVSGPYDVYWNVFGEEDGCLVIRSIYKDQQQWLDMRKENFEKVGADTFKNLMTSWQKHVRSGSETESYPRWDLSHMPMAKEAEYGDSKQ